jgi:hypothetical protein
MNIILQKGKSGGEFHSSPDFSSCVIKKYSVYYFTIAAECPKGC